MTDYQKGEAGTVLFSIESAQTLVRLPLTTTETQYAEYLAFRDMLKRQPLMIPFQLIEIEAETEETGGQ